jgi:hypothetical protein
MRLPSANQRPHRSEVGWLTHVRCRTHNRQVGHSATSEKCQCDICTATRCIAIRSPRRRGRVRRGHVEPKRLSSFEIEHKPQLGRSLHRQLRRLRTFQNLPSVNPYLTVSVGNARSIIHEATGRRELAPRVDGRHFVAGGGSHKLVDVIAEQRVDADLERLDPILYECRESVFYLQRVACIPRATGLSLPGDLSSS